MTDSTKVLIAISGVQTDEMGNEDTIGLSTQGTLVREADGSISIDYQETELTGMEGTTTILRIEGERVSLERRGEYNSTMVFEKNTKYLAMYATPFGTFSMSIFPTRVEAKVADTTVDLDIIYDFDYGVMTGQNRIEIKARPV